MTLSSYGIRRLLPGVAMVASVAIAAALAYPIVSDAAGASADRPASARSALAADPVSGDWKGTASGEAFPDPIPLIVELSMNSENEVTGVFVIPDGEAPFKGTFDPEKGILTGAVTPEDGSNWEIELELDGDEFSGSAVETNSGMEAEIDLERIKA